MSLIKLKKGKIAYIVAKKMVNLLKESKFFDINGAASIFDPISSTLHQGLSMISLILGSILGVIVITFIVRIIFFYKILKVCKELKNQMGRLEVKIDNLVKKKK